MPIHPVLTPGLAAYRRGDYAQALRDWEEPWKLLAREPLADERELCLALVRLAGALHHQRAGHAGPAAELYSAAREGLESLPVEIFGVDLARLRTTLPATAAAALADPPLPRPAPRIPRKVLVRFLLLVLLLATGFALLRFTPLAELLHEKALVALLEKLRGSWWAPVVLLLCFAVLSPLGVPASPLMIAGGVIFGPWLGALYNWLGTCLGGATSYFLARGLGRDFVVHLAGARLRKVEKVVAKSGFWNLVRVRFLPIPFAVVNYGMALSGVPTSLFLSTTALGLLPANVLFTYFAATLFKTAAGGRSSVLLQLTLATLLLALLTLLPNALVARRRRRRYREIVALRRERRR